MAYSRVQVLKGVAFLAGLTPLTILTYRFLTDQLSVNPLDDITDETGTWTLRFIVATLAITPVRNITGWSSLARFRRMAGLFAFFYGSLHLSTYLYFDKFFEWGEIVTDIGKRRFILAGFTAWTLMVPLALTSLDAMMRRLGGKRWKQLHRLTYAVAVAGVIHYLWLVKSDVQRPLIYGLIVAILLGYRLFWFWQGRKRALPSRVVPSA